MASLIPSIILKESYSQILLVGVAVTLLIGISFASTSKTSTSAINEQIGFSSFLKFFYASFLKPHTGDDSGNGQQDALESFYRAQADVYDATRRRLLRGREDMLALVAAQLLQKPQQNGKPATKRIWVDVGSSVVLMHYIRSRTNALSSFSRLVAGQAGTLRQCMHLFRCQSSSQAYISSTFHHHFVKSLGSDSIVLVGKT